MSSNGVPHILHFIWLGKETYPENIIETWKRFHPGWKVMVWKDDDVSSLQMINDSIYHLSKNSYQKSDILRLEVLYTHGGVYCDTDIVCMKSINDLVNVNIPIVVQEKRGVISNSFIATPKFNTDILNMIRCMGKSFDPKEKVWKSTGSLFLTNYLLENNLVIQYDSDRKYDYKSTKKMTILPYYYINMNHDNPMLFLTHEINETDLIPTQNNKDEKYVKYNNFNQNNVYASQLWGGGKRKFYNETLPGINFDMFYKNIYFYMSKINTLRNGYIARDDKIRLKHGMRAAGVIEARDMR
jgi:mannosyltransferase OCH1-like enzyme